MKITLASLALAALLLPFAHAGDTAAPAKAPAPLAKIAIVGASVSSGMGLDPTADPFSGTESKVRLANVVEASLVGSHDAIVDESTLMFFTSPKGIAASTAKSANAAKPSMLVALDYLFWLGYGPGSENARVERLDAGLKALEAFKCPVLLGDFADFNGANVSRMMLAPENIPSKETLDKLNAQLAEWAKKHTNVVVVPVAEMFKKLRADEAIEVRGNKFAAGSKSKLMQQDGLHTTLEGTCALWVIAIDSYLATKPAGVDEKAFEFDVAKLVAKAPTAIAAEDKTKSKPKGKVKEKAGAGG